MTANGGPVTSTTNSQRSKSRGDNVNVRVGGGVGNEIGKVERVTSESTAGYQPTQKSPEGGSCPQITSSDGPQRSRLSQSHTRLRGAPTQNRLQQAALQGSCAASSSPSPSAGSLPDIAFAATSNTQPNRKWALPADLPISIGKL